MDKLFVFLGAAFLAAPAHTQPIPPIAPTMIEPSGKWAVEYDEWRCLLHRDFTTGGKRVLVSLSREPLDPKAWLKVAIEGDAGERDDGNAVMLVDGQRNPVPLHFNYYQAERFQMREFWLDLAKHQVGSINQRARFWTPKHGDIDLNLTGFPAAWTALSKCMADLNGELGISEADVAPMATEPEGWALSAIKHPRPPELEYVALYWVNAAGVVDDCKMLKPSGHKKFDETFCTELKAKGKFKPARDAENRAIRVPRFEHMRLLTQTIYSDRPLTVENLMKGSKNRIKEEVAGGRAGPTSSSALPLPPWPLPQSSFGGARALNLRDWYKVSDYPDASARAGEQGYVMIAFDIGVDGRMSNCAVIGSSGYRRLDEIPCKILPRRARFAPATDANGTAIATKGTTSMSFWTPE